MLTTNRRNLQLGKPPLVYREMLETASSVVRTNSGRCGDLWRRLDVYGSYRAFKRQESELARLNRENKELKTTVRNLQTEHRHHRGSHGDDAGADRRRGGGGGRPTPGRTTLSPQDQVFVRDRMSVCREWNTRGGCLRTPCIKDHVCNMKTPDGRCCKGPHHASLHT